MSISLKVVICWRFPLLQVCVLLDALIFIGVEMSIVVVVVVFQYNSIKTANSIRPRLPLSISDQLSCIGLE
jgi:hypothetical protein